MKVFNARQGRFAKNIGNCRSSDIGLSILENGAEINIRIVQQRRDRTIALCPLLRIAVKHMIERVVHHGVNISSD